MDDDIDGALEATDLLARVSTPLDADATDATELDGGNVGTVYRISFAERAPVAAKVDDAPLGNEAAMLQYLARETPVPVPAVLHVEPGLLLLEYVDGDGRFDERAERDLARQVAALHDRSADAYGFPFDTLSGPFLQSNPWTDSWVDFFRDRRVLPFARAARDDGSLPDATFDRVREYADRLDDLLVEPEAPALLHGDVHPGNVVFEGGEVRAVLDPAIFFGHDEFDLAYVDRIDVIGDAFFDEYGRHRPIDDGFFETRRDAYAAFHELENVRFFGEELVDRLERALDRVGV